MIYTLETWLDAGKPLDSIICGDSLEVLPHIEDKSIDLSLTDPPYGIGESAEKNNSRGGRTGFDGKKKSKIVKATNYSKYSWDKNKVPDELILNVVRSSKNQIIFGGNYYGEVLGDTSCYIVWDKKNGNNDFADCELAWTSFKSAVRIFRWKWNGMLQEDMSNKETRYHPTQKPLPLMEWILTKYSKENQTIIDPFGGSGTTAVACKKLNRRFIIIDDKMEYCLITESRLSKITPGSTPTLEAKNWF